VSSLSRERVFQVSGVVKIEDPVAWGPSRVAAPSCTLECGQEVFRQCTCCEKLAS